MKKGPVVRRTFWAMFYGWLICNAAFLVIAFISELAKNGTILFSLFSLVYSCFFSGIAILISWLFIVIPIDQCVPDNSFIREKPWAGGVGALIGFMTVFLPPLCLNVTPSDYATHIFFSFFGALTGLTTGYHLAKHSPPVRSQVGPLIPAQSLLKLNSSSIMHTLTLFYDARCGLCSQIRQWLRSQPAYLRLEFIPYDSPEAIKRLPAIRHLRADQEIVVMANTGEVWQGAGAWVICLWALQEYRSWSARLASPAMQAMARSVIHWISANRIGISRLLHFRSDADLTAAVERESPAHDACELQPRPKVRHDLDLID
jgi:predicted DCC family thiol-disulfide oxidoreductase YuxK